MHACTDYSIHLTGKKKDITTATSVLAEAFDDNGMIGKRDISLKDSYKIVMVEDITELAVKIAKAAPNISFSIDGTVDASESAGEYMDFRFSFADGNLTRQTSCWYLTIAAEEYDSYEEFCEVYEDYSEEQFIEFCECPHYVLDSGDGEIVTNVPLCAPEKIPVVESKDEDYQDWELESSDFFDEEGNVIKKTVECVCDCGETVKINIPVSNLFDLMESGQDIMGACSKCGKKHSIFFL